VKDIELLLPRVLEKAPQCPEPTAIRHLRDAGIEFCRRTRIWRETDTFDLTERCEPLAPFEGSQIFEISAATYFATDEDPEVDKGAQLDPQMVDWLDTELPGWRAEEGTPAYITQRSPNTVQIVPWAEGQLRLDLILLPANDTAELPDILVDSYPREIADGALGTILLLPAKEWSNPQLGAFHAAEFAKHLDRFGARVSQGQQRARRDGRTRRDRFF
jgi:hypothetical protein